MTFEEMQARWSEVDRKLDSMALASRHSQALQTAKSTTQMQRVWIGGEIAINAVALLWLGGFLARHMGDLAMVLSVLPVHAFFIGLLVSSIKQAKAMWGIDWTASITEAQQHIEQTRMLRIRTNKWALSLAPLLWVPMLAIAFKALFGIDVYFTFAASWLVANVLFGVLFLLLALWTAKRYGDRIEQGTWLRSLVDDFAGRSLASASNYLRDIAAFREEKS